MTWGWNGKGEGIKEEGRKERKKEGKKERGREGAKGNAHFRILNRE
jgi:hypothetical protein